VQQTVSTVIWWAGILLELVIVSRGLQTRLFKNYPIFYLYIVCVFVVSTGLYVASFENVAVYQHWYWPTQLITLILGYGVILSILQESLSPYPGAERFARSIGLAIFFVVFFWIGMHFALNRDWSVGNATTRLERDLRVIEALFLATIVVAVRYYRIGIGRNAKGLILGMGIYVAVSLMILELFTFFGHRFDFACMTLQSGSYLLTLAVWTVALWSYAPSPAISTDNNDIEGDYDALARQTRAKLEALRQYFTGTARS
jgi:hypothetical protein